MTRIRCSSVYNLLAWRTAFLWLNRCVVDAHQTNLQSIALKPFPFRCIIAQSTKSYLLNLGSESKHKLMTDSHTLLVNEHWKKRWFQSLVQGMQKPHKMSTLIPYWMILSFGGILVNMTIQSMAECLGIAKLNHSSFHQSTLILFFSNLIRCFSTHKLRRWGP